jgi:hypothetical protein
MKNTILALTLLASSLYGQGQTLPQKQEQQTAAPKPQSFLVCQRHEGLEPLCGKWTWNVDHFDVVWDNNPPIEMKILSVRDGGDITLMTQFMSGKAPAGYLTCLYDGKLTRFGLMGGQSMYFLNGKQYMTGTWSPVDANKKDTNFGEVTIPQPVIERANMEAAGRYGPQPGVVGPGNGMSVGDMIMGILSMGSDAGGSSEEQQRQKDAADGDAAMAQQRAAAEAERQRANSVQMRQPVNHPH